MKRFLIPLLAAFALPTAVNAETWILMTRGGGFTRSIDASSVVKNGNWRYANLRHKGPYGGSITGIKVDCKNEIYIYPMGVHTNSNDELINKRKSKDNWVWIRKALYSGEEYEEPLSMAGGGDGALSEGIYQFLCKEWE